MANEMLLKNKHCTTFAFLYFPKRNYQTLLSTVYYYLVVANNNYKCSVNWFLSLTTRSVKSGQMKCTVLNKRLNKRSTAVFVGPSVLHSHTHWHIGSYCDSEQSGSDSGPPVQTSIDDKDETYCRCRNTAGGRGESGGDGETLKECNLVSGHSSTIHHHHWW